MPTEKSKRYIVVIDQDKIEPDLAQETVINFDPLNRSGQEGGFYLTEEGELHIDEEDVMEAHRMAIKKYPYEDAIKLVQLPYEEGEKVHQFSDNSFRLYGLPVPEEGRVVGVLGENGTGKSTALEILAGKIKPNLGRYDDEPEWDELVKYYRGTGLQNHFEKLSSDNVEAAFKPQKVEVIPEVYKGEVGGLLEDARERSDIEEISEKLDIDHLLDRKLEELSGGELQRVAIASTLLKDRDIYMIDEPSSFLDVKQRLNVAREIRKLAEDDRAVIVVEHDLATLDLVSDTVHIFYGDPGSYGMVSNSFSSKNGINQYLDGHLPSHNLRIRDESIKFDRSKRSQVEHNATVLKFPEFRKDFGEDEFSLKTAEGDLHEEEILAIFGENGLGKTVFAKMLAGAIEPDEGESPDLSISYKPQYIEAGDETVEEALRKHVNPDSQEFRTRIAEPLKLTGLYEHNLEELSGGELQRVAVAISLARDAEIYLLDEPSAYLDVEGRVSLARTLKRFARKTERPLMVIDHDLLMLDYIADRGTVFRGEPGVQGESTEPSRISESLNNFLKEVDLTYRKDPETGRPRANKPGSQKDQEQRKKGEFYEQ